MSLSPKLKSDWVAALLSLLIPGLGQLTQGRTLKAGVYFVCLSALFFYGWVLGDCKNVWIGNMKAYPPVRLFNVLELEGFTKDLYYRKEYAGQFFVGVAAWPALVQYLGSEPVPAPMSAADTPQWMPLPKPILGKLMQPNSEATLNKLQVDGTRMYELGWVLTIIAGVLNILAIYDALAGPLVREQEPEAAPPKPTPGVPA